MLPLWLPSVDPRTTIILLPFAVAILIAILSLFYWASEHSDVQKITAEEQAFFKCPLCGEKLYITGNSDFKCSQCGAIIPYRSIAENNNLT